MSGPWGERDRKKCCCGGECPGCCFPTTDGVLDPIPFEIAAPSCPSVNGITGDFVDDAIVPGGHPCGSCGSFSWIDGPFSIPSVTYNPDGMGGCDEIPGLGLDVRLKLYCDGELNEADNTSLEACCRRLRLYCGTSYETVCSDPTIIDPSHGAFITVISPTSCTCNPLSVIFSLACLVPKPQSNPYPECPFRPGYEVPGCDFAEIEVVI